MFEAGKTVTYIVKATSKKSSGRRDYSQETIDSSKPTSEQPSMVNLQTEP